MLFDFKGRVVVVIGGASGVGCAVAVAFAQAGATVVIGDLDPKKGANAVWMVEQMGGEGLYLPCDITRPGSVKAVVDTAAACYGRLDYACNIVGAVEGAPVAAATEEEEWGRVIDLNLTGLWRSMASQIPQMVKQGGGAIVNVSSALGSGGFAASPAYTAANHGLIGLTRTVSLEYAAMGIRANVVCPTFYEASPSGRPHTSQWSESSKVTALQRLATPEQVADAVLWFCSDAASFVLGPRLLESVGYIPPAVERCANGTGEADAKAEAASRLR